MAQQVGTCRLCLRGGVELCDSHIVPKFGYKRIRPPSGGGPVSFDGKTALQTDRQVTEHLLCRVCEDLFMKVETRWAPLVYGEGKFPIQDKLGKQAGTAPVVAHELGSVSRGDAIYLAASVVWRGSVCSELPPSLGKYEEEFRLFLLGKREFPSNAEVTMGILGTRRTQGVPEMYQVLLLPWMARMGECHLHRFFLCGCLFGIWVGSHRPESLNDQGLVRGSRPLVSVEAHDRLAEQLRDSVASSRPKGKLANQRTTPPALA